MNVFLVRFITWRYKVNEYGLISQIPTGLFNNSSQIIRLSATGHIGGLYKVFWDTGYWPIFLGYLCFLFWGMGYSGISGYGILEFILGYELN